MIDVKAAALAVMDHFEDIHGTNSVLSFQLIDIKKNEDKNCWEVSCLFYPGLSVRILTAFRVASTVIIAVPSSIS